uniref:Uncharacterized protein n=1 Tax=Octopus bimaculoides TaxID=37653 RepID=A0A0L8FVH7_OCTBM
MRLGYHCELPLRGQSIVIKQVLPLEIINQLFRHLKVLLKKNFFFFFSSPTCSLSFEKSVLNDKHYTNNRIHLQPQMFS